MMASSKLQKSVHRTIDHVVLVAAAVILWQIFYVLAGDIAMAPPIATFEFAYRLLLDGEFWSHVASTFRAFIPALLISIVAGLALGLILGRHRLSGEVTEPMLVALYTVPKVSFYPVILIFFGIGLSAKIAFAALHGIVPMTIFTANAVRNISPIFFKTADALGCSRSQTIRTIIIPAIIPELLAGIRISFSLTLIGTLLSEMLGSKDGLGVMLMQAINTLSIPTIMALTLLLTIFAIGTNWILIYLNHRLYPR